MLFKSCITSLALVALAFSPIAAATPIEGAADLVGRSASTVEKRAAVVERAQQAKARAATKAKRAQLLAHASAQSELQSRKLTLKQAIAAYEATGCPTGSMGVTKCTHELNQLKNQVAIPNVAAPICVGATAKKNGACSLTCASGFKLTAKGCVASATTCGTTTCPKNDKAGTYTFECAPAHPNKCKIVCEKGYTANPKGSKCFDIKTDPDHCGGFGRTHICAYSYDGVGSRVCNAGVCGLTCPASVPIPVAASSASANKPYCTTAPVAAAKTKGRTALKASS